MADPSDLIGAARDVTQQLRGIAGSIAGQTPLGGVDLLGPLQRQAELVEQVLRRQVELEQELVRRAVAPAQATVEALDNAPAALRAQATAFRAAATSFTQAAELLDLQAAAIEQTLTALRAPVALAGRTVRGRRKPPGPKKTR
jgi:hypothetical protein